jgi:hypothetical protein
LQSNTGHLKRASNGRFKQAEAAVGELAWISFRVTLLAMSFGFGDAFESSPCR